MKTIRASELGAYLYCKRAWWLQQQGLTPENQADLITGSEIHEKHGKNVLASSCIQSAAYLLLLGGLILLVIEVISRSF